MAGLYVAAGLNSQGIIFGPGVGHALAAWIDAGAPTIDAATVDVRRFSPAAGQRRLPLRAHARVARPPVRHALALLAAARRRAACAACRCTTGSPRPAPASPRPPAGSAPTGSPPPAWRPWTSTPTAARTGSRPRPASTGGARRRRPVRPVELRQAARAGARRPRHRAARLQRRAGQAARAPWSTRRMLNHLGGIELDATVTRSASRTSWSSPRRRADQDVPLAAAPRRARRGGERRHLGSRRAHVAGPRSRELLATLTRRRSADAAFPFAQAREHLDVGWATALAVRLSFTGELGWELYAPVGVAAGALRPARAAGEELGPAARRLPRPGRAARREGLPPLGRRHGAGRPARRGRPRLHRRASTRRRLHRPRRAAAPPAEAPRGGSCPCCSPTPSRCCTTASRCCAGGAVVGPRHLGRLRPHAGRRRGPGVRSRRRPTSCRHRWRRRQRWSRRRRAPAKLSARAFYDPARARACAAPSRRSPARRSRPRRLSRRRALNRVRNSS